MGAVSPPWGAQPWQDPTRLVPGPGAVGGAGRLPPRRGVGAAPEPQPCPALPGPLRLRLLQAPAASAMRQAGPGAQAQPAVDQERLGAQSLQLPGHPLSCARATRPRLPTLPRASAGGGPCASCSLRAPRCRQPCPAPLPAVPRLRHTAKPGLCRAGERGEEGPWSHRPESRSAAPFPARCVAGREGGTGGGFGASKQQRANSSGI